MKQKSSFEPSARRFQAANGGIIAAVVLFSVIFLPSLKAAVILNDAVIQNHLGIDGLFLTASIPPGRGLFAIEIVDQGAGNFQFNFAGIAEEYALFSASPGTTLDPSFVSLNSPLVSNNGIDPGSAVVNFFPGQSIYFGYWDDRTFGGHPDVGDNYGWARLTRTVLGLEVSESVTAIGDGIIVGTTTQVPEPSRGLLISLGIGVIMLRRRTS